VHLEEDAGKNTHPPGVDYSLVDLNRAGTPLLEIVSEPEIHSAPEAKVYARELYLLMKYAGVSDVDLYHGNMRFDVNISVSQDPSKPGKRAEIKNLNSFRSVENSISYEIERQIELYEKGQEVMQETRGWDEAKQKTTSQRGKEEAHDYRYMPEPDVPPVELDDMTIENIKITLSSSSVKKLSDMVDEGRLNSNAAQNVFNDMVLSNKDPEEIAEQKNLFQVSDESEIEKIVAGVLEQHSQAADDIKNGETKAIGFLVGQVMAKSQGKANPQLAQQIIRKQLGIS
jgi:Asp-tRNA(Asn)/Glu-tRNA(Gln) amidotransferase B subunit